MAASWNMVIAAGGTGGHISPALAIAAQLGRTEPACRVEFACGTRPVEKEIYRKAGVEPKVMDIQPLARGWHSALLNVWKLWRSIRRSRAYLEASRPRLVLGMGGYVCFPIVTAAGPLGIPTMIHEQNSVAGRANRWLARHVRAIACAYPQAALAFPPSKTRVTGNPVRPEFIGADPQAGRQKWDLRADVPTVLVFGGSQGARRINQFVLDALNFLDRSAVNSGGLQVLWSCGESNHTELSEQLGRFSLKKLTVRLVPFIREMGLAYAVADLAVTRAGAMTLAELTANGLAAIVIPLPEATGGHQRLNARPLVEARAALIIEEGELDGGRLGQQLTELLGNRAGLERMRAASRQLGRPRAVEEIVAMILNLVGELP